MNSRDESAQESSSLFDTRNLRLVNKRWNGDGSCASQGLSQNDAE